MKKTTTILLVLCVTAALFAASGLSLKLGGDFDLIFLRTTKVESSGKTHQFKSNGIGFDVGAQYDFSKSIMAYADFNMAFPSDYEVSNDKDSDSYKFSDVVKEFEEKGNKVRSMILFINSLLLLFGECVLIISGGMRILSGSTIMVFSCRGDSASFRD